MSIKIRNTIENPILNIDSFARQIIIQNSFIVSRFGCILSDNEDQ